MIDTVPFVFYVAHMDYDFAIERHRVPLLGHVMGLFVMIGLTEGGSIERLPKPLYRYVLGILRTAESAVRRLIITAARDIVVEPRKPRPSKPRSKAPSKDKAAGEAKTRRKRGFLFSLFDALKRERGYGRRPKRRRVEPHVYSLETFLQRPPPAPPIVEEKVDDGMVNARHLVRRLLAIADALKDIPRHARRYALWYATPIEDRHPQRESALRVGRPPGFRQRHKHEVDEILKECHWLALKAEHPLDTS